jgi:hypothetical protein
MNTPFIRPGGAVLPGLRTSAAEVDAEVDGGLAPLNSIVTSRGEPTNQLVQYPVARGERAHMFASPSLLRPAMFAGVAGNPIVMSPPVLFGFSATYKPPKSTWDSVATWIDQLRDNYRDALKFVNEAKGKLSPGKVFGWVTRKRKEILSNLPIKLPPRDDYPPTSSQGEQSPEEKIRLMNSREGYSLLFTTLFDAVQNAYDKGQKEGFDAAARAGATPAKATEAGIAQAEENAMFVIWRSLDTIDLFVRCQYTFQQMKDVISTL